MMNTIDDAYKTSCPRVSVVPNMYDPRTVSVTGTGCVVACRSNMWTTSEWNIFIIILYVFSYLGFPVAVFLWVIDRKKRKEYLVIWFVNFSVLASSTFVVSSAMPFDEVFCATNAVPNR